MMLSSPLTDRRDVCMASHEAYYIASRYCQIEPLSYAAKPSSHLLLIAKRLTSVNNGRPIELVSDATTWTQTAFSIFCRPVPHSDIASCKWRSTIRSDAFSISAGRRFESIRDLEASSEFCQRNKFLGSRESDAASSRPD